jgi:hypothetical protein
MKSTAPRLLYASAMLLYVFTVRRSFIPNDVSFICVDIHDDDDNNHGDDDNNHGDDDSDDDDEDGHDDEDSDDIAAVTVLHLFIIIILMTYLH